MAHPGFGHLWMQEEMSDIEIQIHIASAVGSVGSPAAGLHNSTHNTLLQQFPGHSPILSLSEYFKAQMLRWSTPSKLRDRSQSHCDSGKPSSKRQAKQQVNITVPDASHDTAAMALLAGLYLVQPWPKLLADLTPQQQVQAAVLADMWQLPAARTAAVGVLQDATGSADRLLAVLEQLLSMEAVPDCLMPVLDAAWQGSLVKYGNLAAVPASMLPALARMLLNKLGNLEAVWSPAGASLQESLLALPLCAIELLLASDRLKVASEDTVLFTAQAYANKLAEASDGHSEQLAVAKLARLVRCPHLSQFWLSASVLSDDAPKLLLRGLQPQLKRLLLLKLTKTTEAARRVADISGVPASWLLSVRDITPVKSVSVQWELDVASIRQAAQNSTSQQKTISMVSAPSSPLGGIRWHIELECDWYPSRQRSIIHVAACAQSLPAGSLFRCTLSLDCAEAPRPWPDMIGLYMDSDRSSCSVHNFFGLGAMVGGFDEAAWAAKGLPTTGSIKLRLAVMDLGL